MRAARIPAGPATAQSRVQLVHHVFCGCNVSTTFFWVADPCPSLCVSLGYRPKPVGGATESAVNETLGPRLPLGTAPGSRCSSLPRHHIPMGYNTADFIMSICCKKDNEELKPLYMQMPKDFLEGASPSSPTDASAPQSEVCGAGFNGLPLSFSRSAKTGEQFNSN